VLAHQLLLEELVRLLLLLKKGADLGVALLHGSQVLLVCGEESGVESLGSLKLGFQGVFEKVNYKGIKEERITLV
jgi:hypothetical protein